MPVLVSDTSVLIDLERGNVLEPAFRLPDGLAVPDLLFRRELEPYDGERMVQMGLRVEELNDAGVIAAQKYHTQQRALSLSDSFALALARANDWLLLTGDAALRHLAEQEAVECHGVLWVFDQMNDHGLVALNDLRDGLRAIASHPRCRLPIREVRARLAHYETTINEKHG